MLKSKHYNFEHIEYARVESNNFYKIRRFTSKSQRKKSETPKIILTNLLKLNKKKNSFERYCKAIDNRLSCLALVVLANRGKPFSKQGFTL